MVALVWIKVRAGTYAPRIRRLIKDTNGDAVVEATILFPVMIMIFAALVLLAMYLPTRAALQNATQYAATAIATTSSDTWLSFDESSMSYCWETDKGRLKNVYADIFSGIDNAQSKGEGIVAEIEGRGISSRAGVLTVECDIVNWLVYKEVVISAAREFTVPVDLSLVGFPKTITVTVTSTAVVQNGDEFVRNMDLAVDFVEYIIKKFELTDISDSISSFGNTIASFLGW